MLKLVRIDRATENTFCHKSSAELDCALSQKVYQNKIYRSEEGSHLIFFSGGVVT